jgi:hypothetical protein
VLGTSTHRVTIWAGLGRGICETLLAEPVELQMGIGWSPVISFGSHSHCNATVLKVSTNYTFAELPVRVQILDIRSAGRASLTSLDPVESLYTSLPTLDCIAPRPPCSKSATISARSRHRDRTSDAREKSRSRSPPAQSGSRATARMTAGRV